MYHYIFKHRHPDIYDMYDIFFVNKYVAEKELLRLFDSEEIKALVRDGIIEKKSATYRFLFRFIPFEKLFMVGKSDIKDPQYAHINYDSVTFIEFLRKIGIEHRRYKRSIEIGCGAGLVSSEIAKVSEAVDSVDINTYALQIMKINADLNVLKNITPYYSDCYENVDGMFDLIISDPPFEIMPENDKSIFHRYGGKLGMEVALKIIEGFDKHLESGGEAIVFTNSYITNSNKNTLVSAINDMLKDSKFRITFHTLSYQINPDFYKTYRECNVAYSIAYIIRFTRSNIFEINIIPLSLLGQIRESIRVAYLYVISTIKNAF
jgi:SAM-dependent methyltransferase